LTAGSQTIRIFGKKLWAGNVACVSERKGLRTAPQDRVALGSCFPAPTLTPQLGERARVFKDVTCTTELCRTILATVSIPQNHRDAAERSSCPTPAALEGASA
jgi:hypothetical protein